MLRTEKKTTDIFKLIMLSLTYIMLTGCAMSGSHVAQAEPPMLKISAGESTVQAVRTTYSWQNGNTGIEADGLHPLDMAEELPVLSVSKDAVAELAFDSLPDQIEISGWKSSTARTGAYDEPDLSFSLIKENTVTLLSDDRYLYLVHAVWNKKNEVGGDAYYGFASAPQE